MRLSWNVPNSSRGKRDRLKTEVSGKLLIPRERQQAVRVAESKCLQRTSKDVRAARKGIGGLLPGAESRSSEARVSDGMLEPIPEDSLHYCLLLGDGDINNRGEGDEAFNTRVCRLRGAQKASMRSLHTRVLNA